MALSAVAGIVDRKGGLRVVVTQRWDFRNHVRRGERLFIVPGFEVQEPVPWEKIPFVITTVQKHVVKQLAPTNHCGDCMACCITPFIKDKIKDNDFVKPSGARCPNCADHFGCKIYQMRPSVCRNFKCHWLKSQSRNDRMPPELRPDRCGAFFADDTNRDPLVFEVHGTPNADAWQWIELMQSKGFKAKKITFYHGENPWPKSS